jgi:hypothetical protein
MGSRLAQYNFNYVLHFQSYYIGLMMTQKRVETL